MKLFIHLSLFFICAFFYSVVAAQTTFQKTYFFGQYNQLQQVLLEPDNGSLITVSNGYFFCTRVDTKSDVIWSRAYNSDLFLSEPKGSVTTDSGFIFLAGLLDKTTQQYKGGMLVKCDKEGNVTWSKQIISKKFASFSAQYILENKNGYIVIYTVNKKAVGSYIMQIAGISKSGDLLWHTTINTIPPYDGDYYTTRAAIINNNDLFIGGFISNQYTGNGELTSTILHLNKYGKLVSFKEVDPYTNEITSTSIDNLFFKKDTLYALGSTSVGNKIFLLPLTETTKQGYATCVNYDLLNLQQLLSKYKTVLPLQNDDATYFMKDRSLVTLSHEIMTVSLHKYDSLGRICPNFTVPATDTSTIQQLFEISDKSFRVVDDSIYLQNGVIQNVAYDPTPTTTCIGTPPALGKQIIVENETIQTKNNQNDIHIFPNPVRDILHVKGLDGSTTITIIDALGKLIKREIVYTDSYNLEVQKLASGTYYLQLQEEKQKGRTYSFIKE